MFFLQSKLFKLPVCVDILLGFLIYSYFFPSSLVWTGKSRTLCNSGSNSNNNNRKVNFPEFHFYVRERRGKGCIKELRLFWASDLTKPKRFKTCLTEFVIKSYFCVFWLVIDAPPLPSWCMVMPSVWPIWTSLTQLGGLVLGSSQLTLNLNFIYFWLSTYTIYNGK